MPGENDDFACFLAVDLATAAIEGTNGWNSPQLIACPPRTDPL
jgi:hypothetical protein